VPATLQITFKSLKPPFSTTIPVSPADPISAIKTQIAAQPRAPPADTQRLLLKGKALADAKLLKEYSVQDGDTINLMLKPGAEWDPAKSQELSSSSGLLLSVTPPAETASLSPPSPPAEKKRGHSRIPSVVLSPTPSSPLEKPQDIQLVDAGGFTLSADMPTESASPQSTYRAAVSQPEYWEKLLAFLRFGGPHSPLMLCLLTDLCIPVLGPSSQIAETRRSLSRTTLPLVKVS
jgi:ubiquitin-like protein 4